MNSKIEQIKEVLELMSVLNGEENKSENSLPENSMVGEYVIVRSRDAGVHAGYLEGYEGREIRLTKSRRLWRWWCKESISLSAVAVSGLKHDDSKVAPEVGRQTILDACEIILCDGDGKNSIINAPVAEQIK